MSVKKVIWVFLAVLAIAAAGFAGFVAHIYRQDYGVPYKGRARLDYNWKYYFAERPVGEYKLEGRFLSYMCPRLRHSMEMKPLENKKWEMLYDSSNLLRVDMGRDTPESIKLEIQSYLDGKGEYKPSLKLLSWLCPEDREYYRDYYKFYDIRTEKVHFAHGGEALMVTLWSKVEERPHMRCIAGITPGGQVFRTMTQIRLNASEETYVETVLVNKCWREGPSISPERDAHSALFLKRFIETVELKK